MRYLFLSVLIVAAPPGLAELYKCSSGTKISYQDKPCQSSQTQTVMPMVIPPPQKPPTSAPVIGFDAGNAGIVRDAHGIIKRSQKAKNEFKAMYPCPANGKPSGACPGYVIDHIQPLACGGADSPDNMQWQTIEEGKEKDRWERKGCAE
jgi:hypothetical protein